MERLQASDATAGAAAPEGQRRRWSGRRFSASAYSNGADSWEAEDVGSLYTQAGSYEEIGIPAAAGSVQDDVKPKEQTGDSGTGESKTGEMSAVEMKSAQTAAALICWKSKPRRF
ncbi:MAG: hypothetical protein ACLUOI_20200 [Eisenbergiella sp.]